MRRIALRSSRRTGLHDVPSSATSHPLSRRKLYPKQHNIFPPPFSTGHQQQQQQSRYFSKLKSSTPKSALLSGNRLQTKWMETTEKILNLKQTPLGSFDSLKWQICETLIIHWTNEIGGTVGLHKSFQLLERMVDEASLTGGRRNINGDDETNGDSKTFQMEIYLIHAILKLWNQLLRKSETNLLPSQVLARIDSYVSRGHCCFQPTIVTYTIILDGASRCAMPKERLILSEKLLLRLIEESENDDKPELRPTVVTFATVMNALARTGTRESAEKAESILWRVYSYHESGWPNMEPNAQIFTTAIHAWANVGDPERAEILLKKMVEEYMLHDNKNVKPNTWSFNAVLHSWCKSSSPNAYQSAETLLRLMIDLSDNKGDIASRPTSVSYNCLLHKLTQMPDNHQEAVFERGENLVNEMIARGSSSTEKNENVLPNLITFTSLFRLLAMSNIHDKQEKAEFWLNKAKEFGVSQERYLLDQYATVASLQEAKKIKHLNTL